MKTITIAVAVAFVFFSSTAQANVLDAPDAQRLHSLRTALYRANVEITQAIDQAAGTNPALTTCLGFIHDQGQSASETAAATESLIALAVLMKDRTDELLVLRQLKIFLKANVDAIPNHREIVNRAMAQCSQFAIVTAKGQTILKILAEMNKQASSLLRIILQAEPR